MKVHQGDFSPLSATGQSGRNQGPRVNSDAGGDDVHLSELVQSLRSLAADSPERQERLEQIARAYADGTYEPDAGGTASGIIDDTQRYS